MWHTDGIGTAPWNELVLDHPVEFFHGFIAFFPVSVQTNHFTVDFIHHQDVRRHLTLGIAVIIKLKVGVNVENTAHTVNVFLCFTSFDLVVGFFWPGWLWFQAHTGQTDVTIKA